MLVIEAPRCRAAGGPRSDRRLAERLVGLVTDRRELPAVIFALRLSHAWQLPTFHSLVSSPGIHVSLDSVCVWDAREPRSGSLLKSTLQILSTKTIAPHSLHSRSRTIARRRLAHHGRPNPTTFPAHGTQRIDRSSTHQPHLALDQAPSSEAL